MKPVNDNRTWRARFLAGAVMTGGLGALAAEAATADPFEARELPGGYMLAADRFVPTPGSGKPDQEGGLCAGEMGSDRDKFIEEGRCAYTDPDAATPEENQAPDDERDAERTRS